MEKLNKFISYSKGIFNNGNQIKEEKAATGEVRTPDAKHIAEVCNDKIQNLPKDFNGYFMIDETYYNHGDKVTELHHLFLYTVNENNQVVLTSYDLPKEIEYKDFINSNDKLTFDYNKLEKNSKFTPIVFKEENGAFIAESEAEFAPGVIFTAKQKNLDGKMYVTEVFRKNGEIVSGSEEPIVYHRVK